MILLLSLRCLNQLHTDMVETLHSYCMSNGVRRDRKMLIVGQQQRGLNTSCFSACYLLHSHSGLVVLCQFTHLKIVYLNQYRRWHFTSKVICHRVNLRSSLICGCTGVEMVIGILRQVPQLSRLKFLDHNLTSENVQRPQWPQNLIFFVCLQLMEVLNLLLLTMSQFLQNSSKIPRECLQKSPKNQALQIPPCQPQVY